MKIKSRLLAIGILLASFSHAFSQPTISSLRLSGQAQTALDTSHLYLSNSASLGANLTFRVTAGGTPPLNYQWQFNLSDLPGQTNSSLNLTNVQLTNAGNYTVVVTNSAGVTNRTAALTVDPNFTKFTTGSIVTDAGYSAGGTWGDADHDGRPDLFVFNGTDGNSRTPFLYLNNGNDTFTKVTSGPPVNLALEANAACWGDYDNDGNLDLFISGTAGQVYLYRNNGDGTFTRNLKTGTVLSPGDYGKVVWGDFDNDGLLDFVMGRYLRPAHGDFYHNNGDGTFTAVPGSALALDDVLSTGCVWVDYDNDGYVDLFVGNYGATNRLYHNNGNGTFTRVTNGIVVNDIATNTLGCAWGDYDNDGLPDLFVTCGPGQKNFLYHNDGGGNFTKITAGSVVNDVGNWNDCAWGDYDNDGWLDLFVASDGDTGVVPTVVNALYHNNGDGTFTKITNGSPVNEYSDSWGCSWVDIDNDGFLELFASRAGGRGNYLYRNNGNSNAWLTVKLTGTASNRAAIGAKVRVKATISGVSQWQLRQISGGSGYHGHNELQANFGLGDATNVDLVRIEWPSGIVQTLTNVTPKQLLTVVEHQAGTPSVPSFTDVSRSVDGAVNLSVTGDASRLYLFEASTNLVNWNWLGVRSNATGVVSFIDTKATNYASRFYRVSVP